MNLYQFISTIKQIVLANNDVNTFNEGDVYEIMNSGQHTYPATVLTINNITTNEQTHYQTINCVLFYIDRLTDDYSNKTMIMSQGFNVLKQIKDKAVESLPWTFETANYTPYTEKFGDLCAGVYLECTIELEDDVICSDTSFTMKQLEVTSNGLYSTIGYDTVLVSVNEPVLHYIEINENGEYTPEEGVDGFSLVVVNVPDPELEELSVTANGTYTPTKYGYSKVDVNVPEQKPEQTKFVTINENGITDITPDEGKVLSEVGINVNVPAPELEELSVTANGTYTPTKYGYSKVNVNVAGGTIKLDKGTKLAQSTWTSVPYYDFSEITDMSHMFEKCSSLNAVQQLDTRNVTDMNNMFYGCSNLKNVSLSNTSSVTNMQSIFMGCTSLTRITYLGCDKCKTLQWAFNGCSKLENANLEYTESVQDWRYTFAGCSSLKSMDLQMHGGLNTEGMFQNCSSLTTVELYNTFNVVFMNKMFENCSSLTSVNNNFNTSKVTDMSYMFNGCSALTTVPQLDASNVNNVNSMFNGCTSLTNFGGLKNVGQSFSTSMGTQLSFASSPNLSDESIQNIIDGLYDRTGVTAVTRIKFHTTVKNKLTNEQKQQITAKNWKLQ